MLHPAAAHQHHPTPSQPPTWNEGGGAATFKLSVSVPTVGRRWLLHPAATRQHRTAPLPQPAWNKGRGGGSTLSDCTCARCWHPVTEAWCCITPQHIHGCHPAPGNTQRKKRLQLALVFAFNTSVHHTISSPLEGLSPTHRCMPLCPSCQIPRIIRTPLGHANNQYHQAAEVPPPRPVTLLHTKVYLMPLAIPPIKKQTACFSSNKRCIDQNTQKSAQQTYSRRTPAYLAAKVTPLVHPSV